jgi:hypothetical protein
MSLLGMCPCVATIYKIFDKMLVHNDYIKYLLLYKDVTWASTLLHHRPRHLPTPAIPTPHPRRPQPGPHPCSPLRLLPPPSNVAPICLLSPRVRRHPLKDHHGRPSTPDISSHDNSSGISHDGSLSLLSCSCTISNLESHPSATPPPNVASSVAPPLIAEAGGSSAALEEEGKLRWRQILPRRRPRPLDPRRPCHLAHAGCLGKAPP